MRGVSLLESLCTVSVVATSISIALPGFNAWQLRHALISAAGELETDIQNARSAAVAQNRPIHLTFRSDAGGSCYVVHDGQAEDCTCTSVAGAECKEGVAVSRQASYPMQGKVQLTHRNASLTFDPEHGTVTPTATFKLRTRAAGTIHQVVSIMGRTRSCTPDGVANIKPC
jgi:type IV fimbrial biogenesis protein FimT